jgi:hypothetical protein
MNNRDADDVVKRHESASGYAASRQIWLLPGTVASSTPPGFKLKRKLFRQANPYRWTDATSFCPEWIERSRIIARLIPKGSRVLEFGAGLSKLPSGLDHSCTYAASDLIGRSKDTWILDLEKRPLPALPDDRFDVAVFAGVLEYLSDVPGVISWISQYVTRCISSYECAPAGGHICGHLKRMWNRASLGWVNAYTEEELKTIFAHAGFLCDTQSL